MSTETGEYPISWHDALAGLIAALLLIVPIEQILTLKILLREDNRRKRLTLYLINLVVANLVFVFSSFTFAVASNISRRYVANKQTCIFFGYLSCVSVLIVFATFAACTGTVYNAVTELKATQLIIRSRKDTKIIVGIWLFSCVILSPMIAIWNRDAFRLSTAGCTPIWTLKTPEDIAYFVILTILGFFLPMILNVVYSINWDLFAFRKHGPGDLSSATKIPGMQEHFQDDNHFCCSFCDLLDTVHDRWSCVVVWLQTESWCKSHPVPAF